MYDINFKELIKKRFNIKRMLPIINKTHKFCIIFHTQQYNNYD